MHVRTIIHYGLFVMGLLLIHRQVLSIANAERSERPVCGLRGENLQRSLFCFLRVVCNKSFARSQNPLIDSERICISKMKSFAPPVPSCYRA
jgi:hypothetical protein